jgi:hypothetical protein
VVNTEAYLVLAAGIVLIVVVVFASLHFLRGYRVRRLQELREQGSSPTMRSDRAYNRLVLARREAELFAAQGGDVAQARQLIDLSDRSLKAHSYDRAYELAQAAHETLVKARREPLRARPDSSAPPTPDPPTPGVPVGPAAPVASTPRSVAPAPPVPKNRVEAQFELRLFERDLAQATKAGPAGTEVAEARQLYVQAHAAFSRADYPEAFRLSLKGRRRVGGHVESLGLPTAAPATPGGPMAADPTQAAEEVAAQGRCPACGHPNVPGDLFCRGCGAARTPATCPSCGTARKPADTFCGRCGARFARAGT